MLNLTLFTQVCSDSNGGFYFRFLEPTQCREDEELEAYVNRIESTVSQDLGVTVTSFTAKDKVQTLLFLTLVILL